MVWIFVLTLDVLAVLGLFDLSFDDGLMRIFESKTQEYQKFRNFTEQFPDQGNAIAILLETDDFARENKLERVSDFILDVQLETDLPGIISALSFPIADASGAQVEFFRADITEPDERAAWFESARRAEPGLERFVSADRSAMIVLTAIPFAQIDGAPEMFCAIRESAAEHLTQEGISMTLTGFPVVQEIVTDRLITDFWLMTAIGAFAALSISAIALNSGIVAMLVALASGTAVLWVLGLFGWVGINLNMITITLPVLILVLSFADALHLSFDIRRHVLAGAVRPVCTAVRCIGPACFMASLTTGIAFAALATSPSALVSEMGLAGILATMVAVFGVLVVLPLLFATLDKFCSLGDFYTGGKGAASRLVTWSQLPRPAAHRPKTIATLAGGACIGAVALYLSAAPNFSFFDGLRANDPIRVATARIETEFTKTATLQYLLPVSSPNRSEVIAKTHAALEQLSTGQDVLSLATAPQSEPAGSEFEARFMSTDGDLALFVVPISYEGAKQTRGVISEINKAAAADPNTRDLLIHGANGVEAMTSFVSYDMLLDMSRGLLIAVFASGGLIAFWLRDLTAGLVSLIPNILPVALIGAWLAVTGRGLDFSSTIALTIAFGLALDDTVHVLNRMRLNLGGGIWGATGEVIGAVQIVLPVLVTTSCVLTVGLIGTLFAQLPSITQFGMLSIAVFILALIADMLVLPACIIAVSSLRDRRRDVHA